MTVKINLRNLFTVILLFLFLQSCGKKEEPQTFIPPQQESSSDKEKERLAKEEFERLKRLKEGFTDSLSVASETDSASALNDTSKSVSGNKTDKTKLVQKEKELNKRLDNPKTAVSDYIEFLQRGIKEGGNFELNMKKASELWENGNINRFKSNYKNTSKIIVLEEPKVVSQKDGEAVVEVRLKKIDKKEGGNEELDMTVKYNMVADSKGKWKIKGNSVIKK